MIKLVYFSAPVLLYLLGEREKGNNLTGMVALLNVESYEAYKIRYSVGSSTVGLRIPTP